MKTVVNELVEKVLALDNEIKLLQEDKKIVLANYKERLDLKAFKAALRIAKIKARLGDSEPTADMMIETIAQKISVE
jgi:uncharacterized protein (UPF0335 family)